MDFSTNEDLSTPEAAYATVKRLSASGDLGFWRRISEPSLAKRMPVEKALAQYPKRRLPKP